MGKSGEMTQRELDKFTKTVTLYVENYLESYLVPDVLKCQLSRDGVYL